MTDATHRRSSPTGEPARPSSGFATVLRSAVLGRGMERRLDGAVAALEAPATPATPATPAPSAAAAAAPLTADRLTDLPEVVRGHLRAAGVVGRPADTWVRTRWTGRFRLGPDRRWMPYEAWQHDTASGPAHLAHMRIDAAGLVPMYGWDTYVGGHGRMVGRLVGLVTVADGRGHEYDVGELTTYVAGVAAVAPALLLDAAALRPVDDRSYEVVMTDRGLRTTCLVELDDDRLPRAVSSDDRWCALPQGLVRARWTLDVTGWTVAADGRAAPTGTRATWDLPDGPFAYVEADLDVARLRRGRDVGAV